MFANIPGYIDKYRRISMRISSRILANKLMYLADALNKSCGLEVGQWSLDHNSTYGGYIIVEMLENGGQHHPLLNCRLNSIEMSNALDMALAVVRLK
jgi:hypothetical protein